MRRFTIAAAILTALTVGNGCYSTRSVPVTKIASLQHGDRGREIVLASGVRGVRVGPRSWVRFRRWDGSRTPWFEARKLRVNDRFVVTTDGRARSAAPLPGAEGLGWGEVAAVEVNELDLEESVVGVTAGTAAVLVVALAEIGLIATLSALSGGHLRVDELGATKGAVESVAAETLKRPEEDPKARSTLLSEPMEAERPARPLFSNDARRKGLCLITLASEGGVDAVGTSASLAGAAVGVRLVDVFEVGFGARSSFAAPAAEGDPLRITSMPFLRFGLHLDLDAARRVAIAVGADLGLVPGESHARLLYGVRVRITDNLQVGVYPWNLAATMRTTAVGVRATTPERMNLIELSWLL